VKLEITPGSAYHEEEMPFLDDEDPIAIVS